MNRSRNRLRGERGAVLLLAFLALMVITVVVAQLFISSTVDRSTAANNLEEVKFDYAARAAFEQAKALLIRDSKDEEEQAESDSGGAGGMGGAGDAGGMGGMGGMGGTGDGSGEDTSNAPTDSLLDEWGDQKGETQQQYGDTVSIRIRVIDEDRKFNLLTLVAEDADYREHWKSALVRLLDTFREDSKKDVSIGEATDLADGIERWLKGERPDDFPKPPQSTDPEDEQEKKKVFEEKEQVVYPLSIDELLAVDGMTEEILHGFMENDRYVPGLEDVATVYSSLDFDQKAFDQESGKDADEEFKNPFGDDEDDKGSGNKGGSGSGSGSGSKDPSGNSGNKGGQNGGSFGGNGGQNNSGDTGDDGTGGEDGGTGGDESGGATNSGRININTAPLTVLRALMPQELVPYSALEKVEEYRRKAYEEEDDLAKSFKSKFDKGRKSDDGRNDGKMGGDDEKKSDEDEEKEDYLFHTPEEVFDKVETYFNTHFDIDDNARDRFQSSLAVKSNVFTIFLEVRSNDSGFVETDRANRESPPRRIYRSVVWRRKGDDEKWKCIEVLPMQPWTGVLPPNTEDYRKDHPFGF